MNVLVRATCVVLALELFVSSIFVNLRRMCLPESITARATLLKSKVQFVEKTGVPLDYKLKHL